MNIVMTPRKIKKWASILVVSTVMILMMLEREKNAQEKVHSIALKQHQIEEAIHRSLQYYLSSGDYVLKVILQGVKQTDTIDSSEPREMMIPDSPLPGFEPDEIESAPRVLKKIAKETYWEITQIRVDLIMYKEISTSLRTYIQEVVPILAGMNLAGGDQFNFIPITPQSLPPEENIAEENTALVDLPTAEIEEAPLTAWEKIMLEIENLGWVEWILLGTLIFLLLLLILLLLRIRRLNREFQSNKEETEIQHQRLQQATDTLSVADPQYALQSIEQAKQEKKQTQDEQLHELLLREENGRLSQMIIKDLIGRKDWTQELVDTMNQEKKGIEKFVIFNRILGPMTARKLFTEIIGKEEYLEIENMAKEKQSSIEEENELLKDIRSFLFARKLSSPEEHDSDPFSFLKKLSTDQVAFLIKDEPVKIKAIVLSRLPSKEVTKIIKKIDKKQRTKVLVNVGKLDELPLDLLEKVAFDLAENVHKVPDEHTVAFNGVNLLADVMGMSDDEERKEMISGLRLSDQDLSNQVANKTFIFETIPLIPKPILTEVVRKMDVTDVITAIVGAGKEVQQAVILCFPENIRQTLVSSLRTQRPEEEQIQNKRQLIIRAMQKMADTDKINLQEIAKQWEQKRQLSAG